MPPYLILLPPSEGKRPGGEGTAAELCGAGDDLPPGAFEMLAPARAVLMAALQRAMHDAADLERLLGVRGRYLAGAVAANRQLRTALLTAALDRYAPGVLYRALDYRRLPPEAQRRLLDHTVIFSGLFGLLRPDDLIPEYRLAMDAVLPGVGRVARFWRPVLSPVLDRLAEGRRVWNLLPAIHQEAWDLSGTRAAVTTVRFVRRRGGRLVPVSHGVKTLRGHLVRHLVTDDLDDPARLAGWTHPEGFHLELAASRLDPATGAGELVFVRDDPPSDP